MEYKALNRQLYVNGKYSIVPIRFEDRYAIMQWRNEQMYHLRQRYPLTKKDQDEYFNTVIAGIFKTDYPDQILFSYLEGEKCIGYGGLVHINWSDKNAEISFIMNTKLENNYFEFYWSTFLNLIEEVAFKELYFHKIYTYAFDLRPHLYEVLNDNGYKQDAVLTDHILYDNKFIDIKIHYKVNNNE